jgi:hypothetical protein
VSDVHEPPVSLVLTDNVPVISYWALMNIMTVDSNDGGTIYPRTVRTDEWGRIGCVSVWCGLPEQITALTEATTADNTHCY